MGIFSLKSPNYRGNIVLTNPKIHFLTLFSFFHPTTFFYHFFTQNPFLHKSDFTPRMRYRIVNPTLTSVQLRPQVMSGVLVSRVNVRQRKSSIEYKLKDRLYSILDFLCPPLTRLTNYPRRPGVSRGTGD